MSTAFLFPGQGAQSPGFLHRLVERYEALKDHVLEASDALSLDVMTLDSEEALASTVAVQLSTVIASTGVARLCRARGVGYQAVAGLSVGAYAAAYSAGAIALARMLALVRLRADLMERAYPSGYGLAAVVGLPLRPLSALVAQVHSSEKPVYIANLNARVQFVLAGSRPALADVLDLARAAGARKAELMAVPVPSHCPLLAAVGDELAAAAADVAIAPPRTPYVTNAGARLTSDPEAIRRDLARNVMYPVLWRDATSVLYETGVRLFVEAPPGRVLSNLAAEAFEDARALALEDSPLDTLEFLAAREARLDEAR
jgi:malonate decarboxylase epsilon subunit